MAEKYDDSNIVSWITKNGAHIPIHDGESTGDAIRNFVNSKRSVADSNEDKKNWELRRREEERKEVEKLHKTTSDDEEHKKFAQQRIEEEARRRVREQQELAEAKQWLKENPRQGDQVKDAEEFSKSVAKAQSTVDPKDAWRVSVHTADEYKASGAKMYKMGDSTVAVTKDGDIISVCKSNTPFSGRGSQLLDYAVKQGGTKLDSFSGNHEFYCKNGFQPVSWTKFDHEYKPDGWERSGAREEPVVFYKYVGKGNVAKADYDIATWTSKVSASKDYDTAQSIRDKDMKGGKK